MLRRSLLLAGLAAPAIASHARAAQPVTYLFPAPAFLPAFVPHQVAMQRGYFAAEDLAVTFRTGRGGADVATQVAVGNADLGGGVGETSMIVRANGLTVRGVALLGGQPMFQIAVRTATGIRSIAELRGKKVGVIGYQDTGYYALLGALAASGLRRADLQIQAVGPAAITQLMIAGNLDAIMATPDWADNIEVAGIPLTYFPIDALFPAMAQAVLASDKVVAEKPAVVRGFVRAMLKALRETMADPAAAARDFIAAVPQHAGKETEIERITRAYGAKVYRTDNLAELGRFDPARLERVQRFYIENQIIQAAAPIADLYTNDFVGN